MILREYTGNSNGMQFDPRTKIILLILCVISATIAPSLLYESVLVFVVAVFGCASGKVLRSLLCAAFYGVFYMLTLFIMSLERGGALHCLYILAWLVLYSLPLCFLSRHYSFHN